MSADNWKSRYGRIGRLNKCMEQFRSPGPDMIVDISDFMWDGLMLITHELKRPSLLLEAATALWSEARLALFNTIVCSLLPSLAHV